jgi:hypothetical protein
MASRIGSDNYEAFGLTEGDVRTVILRGGTTVRGTVAGLIETAEDIEGVILTNIVGGGQAFVPFDTIDAVTAATAA